MNQIIQALVEKAIIRFNNPIVNSDGKVIVDDWQERISISKFAELIVRECASVDLYWLSEQDRTAIAEKIKEHFGVE